MDEAILAKREVIEQTRRVKEGLLQDLLTRGIGHTRFKQTEIGEIPEAWEAVRLGRVCSTKNAIVDGPFGSNLKTEHYRTEGIPVIQTKMVTSGVFVQRDYVYVEPSYFEQIRRSAVQAGDIVMAKIGMKSGRSCILPPDHPESVLAGNCLRIKPDPKRMDVRFVHEFLEQCCSTGDIRKIRTETVQRAMAIGRLKRFRIPVPPFEEQRMIADIMDAMNVRRQRHEDARDQLQQVKAGLLQDLLTGKVRVTV